MSWNGSGDTMVPRPRHLGTYYDYPLDEEDENFRAGVLRPTMRTNVLLIKPELGKAKKSTFARHDLDHVFGYTPPADPEGAREVMGVWKEHSCGSHLQQKPDFKTMNKLAAISGVTTAREQASFRGANYVPVKQTTKIHEFLDLCRALQKFGTLTAYLRRMPESSQRADHKAKHLPSDYNVQHSYGLPSAHRSAEVRRVKGPQEPPIKHLLQGAYQTEWVAQNAHKGVAVRDIPMYIPPVPTRATLGHAIGAQKYIAPQGGGEEWKMTKFRNVESKLAPLLASGRSAGPGRRLSRYQAPVESAEELGVKGGEYGEYIGQPNESGEDGIPGNAMRGTGQMDPTRQQQQQQQHNYGPRHDGISHGMEDAGYAHGKAAHGFSDSMAPQRRQPRTTNESQYLTSTFGQAEDIPYESNRRRSTAWEQAGSTGRMRDEGNNFVPQRRASTGMHSAPSRHLANFAENAEKRVYFPLDNWPNTGHRPGSKMRAAGSRRGYVERNPGETGIESAQWDPSVRVPEKHRYR